MSDTDERAAAMLKSPLGCAFLLIAEASGLGPRELAEPAMSFYVAARAASDTEVWRADRDWVLNEVLQRGRQRADLARALMEEPNTAWWFGRPDTDQQVWISRDGTPPDSARLVTPPGPPSRHERYSQRPAMETSFLTSTLRRGASSIFATVDERVGDIGYGFGESPYACWRLAAGPSARIFEIDGPLAWHDLCVRYPAEGRMDSGTPDFSGDEGRLCPDWSAVAGDWDAVHLSLGGLLTSDQVRIDSSSGWTYHWDWQLEHTVWLRWMFIASERMADHHEAPLPEEIVPLFVLLPRHLPSDGSVATLVKVSDKGTPFLPPPGAPPKAHLVLSTSHASSSPPSGPDRPVQPGVLCAFDWWRPEGVDSDVKAPPHQWPSPHVTSEGEGLSVRIESAAAPAHVLVRQFTRLRADGAPAGEPAMSTSWWHPQLFESHSQDDGDNRALVPTEEPDTGGWDMALSAPPPATSAFIVVWATWMPAPNMPFAGTYSANWLFSVQGPDG